MHFTLQRRHLAELPDLPVVLNLPGRHNVLNALAAIALALELKLPDEAVLRALATFGGVGRRFQRYGEVRSRAGGLFTLVDDYGHHPAEMAATLAAARGAFPGRRLLLAFQPHRYTRTRDCFEDFVAVMAQADAVLLTEVYSAGEASIAGADGRSLQRALSAAGRIKPIFVDDITDVPQAIMDNARAADVALCMGAGSMAAVPAQVVALGHDAERLSQQEGRA
jgi:UDP-N-acetylmuramate--alanine ligase